MAWIYDITKRKQADEEARASQAQLQVIIESRPYGITIVKHGTGERIYSNPTFNRMMTGVAEPSMVGIGIVVSISVGPSTRRNSKRG